MYTTSYISEYIDGVLHGKSDLEINGVCSIKNSKPGFITFLTSNNYDKFLGKTKASAVIVNDDIKVLNGKVTLIKVNNAAKSFSDVVKLFNSDFNPINSINNAYVIGKNVTIGENVIIGDNTILSDDVIIGDNVKVGPNCFIGKGTTIKTNSRIDSNVTIYHEVMIGKNVYIASGSRIGAQGFGIIKDDNGNLSDFPHIGSVILNDNVSIGANSCIDRGTINDTIIGDNTKIDNLVQIGHNVIIGSNCIIAAQSGVAGSTDIGNNVTMAGQVGVVGHIYIVDDVTIGSKSAVMQSIKKPGTYSGIPTIDHQSNKKRNIMLKNFPELYKKIKKII